MRDHESIVNAAPSGIVLVDATQDDMPIVFVNPAFERITGYSAAEVIGRNCRFLQGDDQHQDELQSLRDSLRLRHANSVVLRNFRKDGSLFWNHLIVTPVPGAGRPCQPAWSASSPTSARSAARTTHWPTTLLTIP